MAGPARAGMGAAIAAPLDEASHSALAEAAKRVRRHIVQMVAAAASGHPGGSLSAVELLVGLYFGGVLRYQPHHPSWPERDRFILSKGHATPVLYAVLAEAGGDQPTMDMLIGRMEASDKAAWMLRSHLEKGEEE